MAAKERMLPLYQGMMTSFYDHRAADVVRSLTATQRQNQPRYLTDAEKADPTRLAIPQYWVREANLASGIPDWLLAFSDITSPTNERTLVLVALPKTGVGNTLPILIPSTRGLTHCLLACLSSFVVDFQVRQKVGGIHINFFYLKQVPVPGPRVFEEPCPWRKSETLSVWVAQRVIELVATANDMVVVGQEFGIDCSPFQWEPERRAYLRAELDAAFFHVYGLSRNDTEYVMDTFPTVRRNEEERYGEFRTKRLILECYDAMASATASSVAYKTPLDPPPAHPSVAHSTR